MTDSSSWHGKIRSGTTDVAAALCLADIDHGRLAVNARSALGYSLLMEAAHAKDLRLVEGLLARRADVTRETEHAAALYWACRRPVYFKEVSSEAQAVQVVSRLLAAWPANRDWRLCRRGPLVAALESRWFSCSLWLLGLGAYLTDGLGAYLTDDVTIANTLCPDADDEVVKLATTFRVQVSNALLGSAPVCVPLVVCHLMAAYVV